MLPAPRVKIYLVDAQTGVPLHWETIDGTKTFKGSSGQEFDISVEVERRKSDDQRVFTVLAKLDGDMIGYSFHLEGLKKQTCIFDGFPTNNGCGRSMFKFNDITCFHSSSHVRCLKT